VKVLEHEHQGALARQGKEKIPDALERLLLCLLRTAEGI
jgi:hypothetical protein